MPEVISENKKTASQHAKLAQRAHREPLSSFEPLTYFPERLCVFEKQFLEPPGSTWLQIRLGNDRHRLWTLMPVGLGAAYGSEPHTVPEDTAHAGHQPP